MVLKAWRRQRERDRKPDVTFRWPSCSHFTLCVGTEVKLHSVSELQFGRKHTLLWFLVPVFNYCVTEHSLHYVPEFQEHLKMQ